MPTATGIRRAAMDWLARREHSRREIEEKLRRRFPDATAAIGPVLDSLEHEGLLSDARFVEALTRSLVRRGYGPMRIAADLRQRGMRAGDVTGTGTRDETGDPAVDIPAAGDPPGTAAAVNAAPPADWLALARDARRRRFGEVLPSGPVERNRQMAFLQRRGFPSAICQQACRPPRDE